MPSTSNAIAVTVTSGVKGQPITISNRNTGDVMHETLGATAKASVDLSNFASGYTAGDVIDLMVTGAKIGAGTYTSGNTITVSTASIQTTVSRGM